MQHLVREGLDLARLETRCDTWLRANLPGGSESGDVRGVLSQWYREFCQRWALFG